MKVFKFGGASVKDADAVKNVAQVIKCFPGDQLIVIVSAMAKTTNALEAVLHAWYTGGEAELLIQERKNFHYQIMDNLLDNKQHPIYHQVDQWFHQLTDIVREPPVSENFDRDYDRIVSKGELLSTTIVNAYLQQTGAASEWLDVRNIILTDDNFREGAVDWQISEQRTHQYLTPLWQSGRKMIVTQGFMGQTAAGDTTTLGREGSDYTGAILAYLTDADSLTIWKDVPGVLNADPKWFNDTVKLEKISYQEAIELAYYGASVIHPKTLKPLQNKQIPLYVKSFLHPDREGTVIQSAMDADFLIPSFIFKMQQVLLTINPADFSFIVEKNLSEIFQDFAEHRVKINMMQNSALNFYACVDDSERIPELLNTLKKKFNVSYHRNLELVTIRHYDQSTIDRVTENKTILVEQKNRYTVRMVMHDSHGPYKPRTDYPH